MNEYFGGNIKIFSCNASKSLATNIAKGLGLELGRSEVGRFSDGEISLRIFDTVRGDDVYIVQSTCPPVNDNIMELLIMIDAMKRASAGSINAVIPYFGYARQDRKTRARDPISAKLVADIITAAGADRVLTMDLHCAQIQGFFHIPVDHLKGEKLLSDYYAQKFESPDDLVAVSPDLGSVSRVRSFAKRLNIPLAIIDKRRPAPNISEVMNIIGNVEGKKVILLDDIIDTAGSITNAAAALKSNGATEIYACCTHPILSGDANRRIMDSDIKELLTLDTVVITEKLPKLKVVSVADVFAKTIFRIHSGLSVSELF